MRLDIAVGTGFVLETGVYCAYTCLFIAALPILTNAKRLRDVHNRTSAWVFLMFSILMYLVATLHLVFTAFRFYKSILLNVDPKGPISYLQNLNHWEYLGFISLLSIQIWLGNVLMIYRCYVVWSNNLWFIVIPICLLFGQIGFNSATLHFLGHLSSLSPTQVQRMRSALYALPFAQNCITTGLIILKISLQHRASKKAGIVAISSRLGLIRVVQIIIESAAIYTILMLVMVILSFRHINFQNVIQAVVTPSIGITFVLLAVRIEASRNEYTTRRNKDVRSSLIPRLARHNDSEISSGYYNYGSRNSLASGDANNVVDHKVDVQTSDSGADDSWDPESSSNPTESRKAFSVPLEPGGVRE